jgi:hypothetical protein
MEVDLAGSPKRTLKQKPLRNRPYKRSEAVTLNTLANT